MSECSRCKHYMPYVDGRGDLIYAECRRCPPTSQRVPGKYRDTFPEIFEVAKNWSRVGPTDWCGEFSTQLEKRS
jgi:hypothetical protein